jgi:hypothetical protein
MVTGADNVSGGAVCSVVELVELGILAGGHANGKVNQGHLALCVSEQRQMLQSKLGLAALRCI